MTAKGPGNRSPLRNPSGLPAVVIKPFVNGVLQICHHSTAFFRSELFKNPGAEIIQSFNQSQMPQKLAGSEHVAPAGHAIT